MAARREAVKSRDKIGRRRGSVIAGVVNCLSVVFSEHSRHLRAATAKNRNTMLTALGTWFRHRQASRQAPGDRPPGPADAASAATVEAIQVRVARWFARELPAQVALAQPACPRWWRPAPA